MHTRLSSCIGLGLLAMHTANNAIKSKTIVSVEPKRHFKIVDDSALLFGWLQSTCILFLLTIAKAGRSIPWYLQSQWRYAYSIPMRSIKTD